MFNIKNLNFPYTPLYFANSGSRFGEFLLFLRQENGVMSCIYSSLLFMNSIKIIHRSCVWARIQTVWALGTGRHQVSNILEIIIQDRNILSLGKRYRQKIMFSLCHLDIKEITSCTDYIAVSRIQTDCISAIVFIEKG